MIIVDLVLWIWLICGLSRYITALPSILALMISPLHMKNFERTGGQTADSPPDAHHKSRRTNLGEYYGSDVLVENSSADHNRFPQLRLPTGSFNAKRHADSVYT